MVEHEHRPGLEYPRPPLPPDEPRRLEALKRYEILDTLPEQMFDWRHISATPQLPLSR
jgi:hypothetical protein